MPTATSKRNRNQLPFYPGNTSVFNLPAGGKLLRGKLILAGTITLAGGTVNGTMIGEGGPINLIRRIRIMANRGKGSRYPGGLLVDASPRSLIRNAVTQRNGKFFGDLYGQNLGNGANGVYPVYLSIPIYFADGTLRNQVQTALNLDPLDSGGNPIYTNVQVQVDCAPDLQSCFLGNNANVTYNLTMQWVDDRIMLAGDTVPLVQESHDLIIPAPNARTIDYALPQDGAFLSMHLLGEVGTYKTLGDTLLNRATFQAPTLDYDKFLNDIKVEMLDDEWLDPSQNGVGQYFIDFSEGSLMNSVPAQGLSQWFDLNNPSGSNLDTLTVFTRRVFALAPLATS